MLKQRVLTEWEDSWSGHTLIPVGRLKKKPQNTCFNEKKKTHTLSKPLLWFPLELLLTLSLVPHLIEQHLWLALWCVWVHSWIRTPNLFESIPIFVWLGGKKHFICGCHLLMHVFLLSNFNSFGPACLKCNSFLDGKRQRCFKMWLSPFLPVILLYCLKWSVWKSPTYWTLSSAKN